MADHRTATREEWLQERVALLAEEKELTKRDDELTRKRMALPWVPLDKEYRFETEDGPATLADLFQGRSQLMIYHFMFGPDYKAGCPSCSAVADGINGNDAHLRAHDVAFWVVSRGPLDKLLAYRKRMGWTFPWASSAGSDFNFDFGVSFTPQQQRDGLTYNFSEEPPVPADELADAGIPSKATPDGASRGAAAAQIDTATYAQERPGVSSFAMQNRVVHHTYSAYSRGVDSVWNAYRWLDRAPKGRNESEYWWRRHDEYKGA